MNIFILIMIVIFIVDKLCDLTDLAVQALFIYLIYVAVTNVLAKWGKKLELKLVLPDDVDAFDIFCYRHEGALISVPTIHINKDIGAVEIFRENGIYYAVKFPKREKNLEEENE